MKGKNNLPLIYFDKTFTIVKFINYFYVYLSKEDAKLIVKRSNY